jgi:uncharacterized protein (UPF0216 family)
MPANNRFNNRQLLKLEQLLEQELAEMRTFMPRRFKQLNELVKSVAKIERPNDLEEDDYEVYMFAMTVSRLLPQVPDVIVKPKGKKDV